MDSKADLMFRYTEQLGYLSFSELINVIQQGISIEQFFQENTTLSESQLLSVKFLVFKHYFVEIAKREGIFTKEQSGYLIREKILEIKKQDFPLSLLSLAIELMSPEFFKNVLEKLDAENLFSLQEFRALVPKVLAIQEKYQDVMDSIFKKTSAEIKTFDLEDGIKKYEITCKCGNFMIFEMDADSRLKLFCPQCRQLVLDLKKKDQALSGPKTTFNQAAPELVKKISREANRKQLDTYRLIRKLGEGGAGRVYLAKHEQTGEQVALKILQNPEKDRHMEYFQREIKILQKLQHPNIVGIKNWGVCDEKPYLTMEYVPGQTLLELISRQKILSAHQACKIIAYVLDALYYASQYKVVHRDIKPANIFIGNQGEVKVIDLGISKILDDSLGITQAGQIMGTPFYAAPEQIKDATKIDHRADIYSVGATLYHLLCGTPPFSECATTNLKVLWHKINNSYVPLREKKPDLPESVVAIVEKSMAFHPKDRYDNAQEMRHDLANFYKQYTSTIEKIPRKR